ncbi:MAG: hypothetical protein FJ218_05140 [Ignavibacteria bacterium]|nr:hypothetical protein [Ignavibacteria bacterium]
MNKDLILCSDFLSLKVDAIRGGNIKEIKDVRTQLDWIHYDASRMIESAGKERVYDDIWCGGFEELFPNDAPCFFEGRNLLDHGELWDARFDIVEYSSNVIHLRKNCVTVPAVFEKRIILQHHTPKFSIEYTLENTGNVDFSYLLKLHPAMNIQEGDRIILPGGKIIPVDIQFSKIIGEAKEFDWPIVTMQDGTTADVSIIPIRENTLQEFIYVIDMPKGICGIYKSVSKQTFNIHFPLSVFPYCWLFLSYGGWRNYYTVVLEPCTNYPKDMSVAKTMGNCAILNAFEKKTFTVEVEITQQ